jgi:hypothetical protein
MGTLPPPKTNEFPVSSIEKKVYNLVEQFSAYLPVPNDRNRLGFALYKYMTGEGDPPEILIKSLKLKIEGILPNDLVQKLNAEIETLKN